MDGVSKVPWFLRVNCDGLVNGRVVELIEFTGIRVYTR